MEKMIEIIKAGLDTQFGCGDMVDIGDKDAAAEIIAEDLQKAGYGDTKQAIKEFAERLRYQMELEGYRSPLHNRIIDKTLKEYCEK